MNHRKSISLLILLALISGGVGFVFTNLEKFNSCRQEYIYNFGEVGNINNLPSIGCLDPLRDSLGQPLLLGSIAIGLILIILLFCSKDIFSTWFKWAAWLIPAGALWIMVTPVSCDAPLGACVDKEIATFVACSIFVVASLLVIIGSFLRFRRGRAVH